MSTGIIFSSVRAFVEQVGRRVQWKYAELDNLLCTYIGPSASALQFKPPINSPHPQYPLMFVTDSSITNKEAGVAEVSVTYQGKILTGGQTSYIGPPIISESPTQGSRDFMLYILTPVFTGVVATGLGPTGAQFTTLYDVATQQNTVRYIGQACSVRYQAYPLPSAPHYKSLGLGKVKWSILSQTRGQMSTVLHMVLYQYAVNMESQFLTAIPPLFAAYMGMQVEQIGNWYNITENYGPTF